MGNWQKRLALQQSFVGREPAQMQLNQRGQKLRYIKKLFKADFFFQKETKLALGIKLVRDWRQIHRKEQVLGQCWLSPQHKSTILDTACLPDLSWLFHESLYPAASIHQFSGRNYILSASIFQLGEKAQGGDFSKRDTAEEKYQRDSVFSGLA